MGDFEADALASVESTVKYHPCICFVLTWAVIPTRKNRVWIPAREQCLMGSLTGAVASQRVAEAFKGRLDTDGNRIGSVYA